MDIVFNTAQYPLVKPENLARVSVLNRGYDIRAMTWIFSYIAFARGIIPKSTDLFREWAIEAKNVFPHPDTIRNPINPSPERDSELPRHRIPAHSFHITVCTDSMPHIQTFDDSVPTDLVKYGYPSPCDEPLTGGRIILTICGFPLVALLFGSFSRWNCLSPLIRIGP